MCMEYIETVGYLLLEFVDLQEDFAMKDIKLLSKS